MTAEKKCPKIIHDDGWGFHSHVCGRPVKRDGLCGMHAAAKERRERGDAARLEEARARQNARTERDQVAAALSRATGLLIRGGWQDNQYVIDHETALAWLRSREDGEK